ncbi:hypothetical protein ACOJBO_43325 [Rhizobium beringeri]
MTDACKTASTSLFAIRAPAGDHPLEKIGDILVPGALVLRAGIVIPVAAADEPAGVAQSALYEPVFLDDDVL